MRQQRKGFTLIEMMVSVALCLFVMVLLSQAFAAALETFRQLKGIGDMDDRLRVAASLLRRDLSASHFNGTRRISDANFFGKGPPDQGFVRIWQGSPTLRPDPNSPNALVRNPRNVWEELDGDGIPSARSTDHMLQMTVRQQGNTRDRWFTADVSTDAGQTPLTSANVSTGPYQLLGTYTSQWAEVAYYLVNTGQNANGTPLFALMRRQRLLVPDNANANSARFVFNSGQPPLPLTATNAYAEMSYTVPYGIVVGVNTINHVATSVVDPNLNPALVPATTTLNFNSPSDITMPGRRFGVTTFSSSLPTTQLLAGAPLSGGGLTYPTMGDEYGSLAGSDIIMTDVVSFDVRVMTPASNGGTRILVNPNNMSTPIGTLSVDQFIDLFDSQSFLPENQQQNSVPIPLTNTPPAGSLNPVGTDSDLNLVGLGGQVTANNSQFPVLNVPGYPIRPDQTDSQGRAFATLGPRVFDTWSSQRDTTYDYTGWGGSGSFASLPNRLRIQAVRITLRIWDRRTQQTRQVTIIQDM